MVDNVEIDGVQYAPVNVEGESLRIVIVDNRGLTFVGRCEDPAECDGSGMITIRNARCIIQWGTKEHLAELAASGPKTETRLGLARDVKVAVDGIVLVYECDASVWKNE